MKGFDMSTKNTIAAGVLTVFATVGGAQCAMQAWHGATALRDQAMEKLEIPRTGEESTGIPALLFGAGAGFWLSRRRNRANGAANRM